MLGLFFMRVAAPAPPPVGVSEPDPDLALVAAAQANPRAFGPLFDRYHDTIYRFCFTRLGHRQAAEDATAETFLKAFANLEHFKPGVFLAWLYTIARHAVADAYRKDRPAESWDEHEERAAPPEADGAGREPIDRVALRAALAQLPADQRAVLELQLSGWAGPEIAAAVGKSHAAVKMLRFRAMERLRQLLAEDGGAGGRL